METRADKSKAALALREKGLTIRQVAAEMGLHRSYVHGLINDPDRSQEYARRRQYGRPCVDCGKLTDGSAGRPKAPERCQECRYKHDEPAHGTSSRYQSVKWKCRCVLCRRAWADYMRDYYRKRRAAA